MVLKKLKANPLCWNIKNFMHWSQKKMYFSKKDQMSWFMQKPNEKLLSCVINLWKVIYVHFYNWDWSLELVLVVYDLIELIIETSHWSKDYFTLDTHPQHTRLWFNECLSHLCDGTCSSVIIHVQMWCVCSSTWWSNPKIFLSVLFVFESDFILSCF